jgi:hypothetical protein
MQYLYTPPKEWVGVFGHGEWGIGHGEEVTNAQCPKRRGDYPSPPKEWVGVKDRTLIILTVSPRFQ